MSKPKAIVTRRWPTANEERLKEHFDVTFNESDVPFTSDQLKDALKNCDVFMPTVTDKVTREVLSVEGRTANMIANFGVGFNHVDIDPFEIPENVVSKFGATKLDTIEDICKQSDFVSVNCPATKETFHLMNKERFEMMKPTAFVINTARGDIIDEKALVDALVNKEIAGAGLDVFETEPNLPSELKTLENVVSFPHLGSATIETRIAMGDTAINNALAFFEGKDLPNKVV